MANSLARRPSTNGSSHDRGTSFTSIPPSSISPHQSVSIGPRKNRSQTSLSHKSIGSSGESSQRRSVHSYGSFQAQKRRYKSQYPADSPEPHVEYILVASFDVDRGPIMEHQYPSAISGDESMLAELMLPDQTHVRSQDWTIFFLHKDNGGPEEDPEFGEDKDGDDEQDEEKSRDDLSQEYPEEDDAGSAGMDDEPPLIGAMVKAMAICTRHSFLHIYKPLLLLALEDYFKHPFPETLAKLYDSLNAMDLSLMPCLSYLERHILQSTETKDLFVEKFERMIKQRLADERAELERQGIDPQKAGPPSRYTVPRDTHEFESKIVYNDIAIPVKVPTAISPETVGDFSLVKLIQTFAGPHAASPQPFALHPHLTSSGPFTHPIIVLVNALLTQKRVIFLGHNRPSGEVAEAVLATCALASGGTLRGFTRHAFPYTDLTKIDELIKVPGFVAGVTNPTFANHHEWWDLLCDLPSGRMKISNRVEAAPVTEGMQYFQPQNQNSSSSLLGSSSNPPDLTGDVQFMDDILKSIASRHSEGVIRAKWRAYINKFTRISATFEEIVYGATALDIVGPDEPPPDSSPMRERSGESTLRGHGYVWVDEATKQRELAAWVPRIEGWRNTRSYYYFIQDTATMHLVGKPLKGLDVQHHHDRLRTLKLSDVDAKAVYVAFSKSIKDYNSICQLLSVIPETQAGLFYLSMGLFHNDSVVRNATVDLLDRISVHEAGRHFWAQLSRFARLAYYRIKRDKEREVASPLSSPFDDNTSHSIVGVAVSHTSVGTKKGVRRS
ncbi:uncharacterized protein ARB_04573 [Trichophyton benhamiae CBS 112371]|uniref:UDENN domain-containing protein n=1 Tax=Arthroderma benhamiae (strain ATCC MYA-4681 / CBS 112371) TaxID=663331 RepID=D4AJX3_ARTBC|nr:uncharacterized protein ARB_04573 [Trichophyton benhamiae CBS 112371]EFE37046.1 hypothetical protein ARB_04573 [Trichophyton benhamiae CBS 112371]